MKGAVQLGLRGSRTLRYVCVGNGPDPDAALRPWLDAGWTTDGRVVLPASGRAELATVLIWKDWEDE